MTASELLKYRKLLRSSFYDFCVHALKPLGQTPAKHHRILIDALQDVADGKIKRLMVCMPPGSAKSTFASVLFPAWWMARNANKTVLLTANTSSLAESFSKSTKSYVLDNQPELQVSIDHGNSAVLNWKTTNNCSYKCRGTTGTITGFRSHLGIIDDPVKDRSDVENSNNRDKLWDWYRSSFTPRLLPDAAVIICMTRWHDDDLGGRVLQQNPDAWHVISIPAVCVDPLNDPLGRELGETHWQEFYTQEVIADRRATIGERDFSALYQQKPIPDGGCLINTSKIGILRVEPSYENCDYVRAWDIAVTSVSSKSKNPDFTVGVKMARRKTDGQYYVLDVVRIQGEPSVVEQLIFDTAEKDGKGVKISIPIDPGAGAKGYSQYLTRMLAGYDIEASHESGTKIARATPMIAQMNGGSVSIMDAIWNRNYLDELSAFPGGLKDDQVDASSRAFNYLLCKVKRPAQWLYLNRYR